MEMRIGGSKHGLEVVGDQQPIPVRFVKASMGFVDFLYGGDVADVHPRRADTDDGTFFRPSFGSALYFEG